MTTKKYSATATGVPVKRGRVKHSEHPVKSEAKPDRETAAKIKLGAASKPDLKRTKKSHKEKVVRDSFTMPKSEYQKIAEIKEICLKAGMHVKKSEVLRAGLKALCEKTGAQLRLSLGSLEKIQTGRPKKH